MTRLFRITSDSAHSEQPLALTIGNFDGVHRGHQALLARLCQEAKARQLIPSVMLFEPQPVEYLCPDKAKARLCRLADKVMLLKELGIQQVFCMRFNQTLADMSAHDFAHKILFNDIKAQYLLLGADFRFGHKRQGHVDDLALWARAFDIDLDVMTDVCDDLGRISSTAVREALSDGDMERARELLSRYWFLCGRVGFGDGRGKEFGFPTANIHLQQKKLPASGVFCVELIMGDKRFEAVANLGTRPTVDGRRMILEVHIFNFNQHIYGQRVQVNFLHKLRNEVKFNSIDDLIQHIHIDVEQAQQYFKGKAP